MAAAEREGEATRATEATPLLTNDIDWVRREFEDALHEEEPESQETFASLLWKRPGTLIVILVLFVSISLIGKQGADFLSSPEKFARMVDARLVHAELIEIRESQIEARVVGTIALDYEKLGGGLAAKACFTLASLLGSLNIKFPGAIDVRAKTQKSEFDHALMVHVPDQFSLNIVPNAEPTLIDARVLIDDIGRQEVIGYLTTCLLRGNPISAQVHTPVQFSKWGLDYSLVVTVEQAVKSPKSQQAMTDVTKVHVNAANDGSSGLNVTADIVTHVDELPFSVGGELPPLKWAIKIPGCRSKSLEAANGQSDSIVLDQNVNITTHVWASIERLPKTLTAGCENNELFKSPLDIFISRYLAGEVLEIQFSGAENQGILSQLLAGIDFPFSMDGKPSDEKLVQTVKLEQVRFSQTRDIDHPTTFSGEAIIDVALPRLIDIDREHVIAAVTKIRGTIDLLTPDEEGFGTVNLEEWSQTITLATEDGYQIKCFFHDVPFDITNAASFTEVSEKLLINGKADIEYETHIDAEIATPVGSFLLRQMSLKGATSLSTGLSERLGNIWDRLDPALD